jgi:hypothetical protein
MIWKLSRLLLTWLMLPIIILATIIILIIAIIANDKKAFYNVFRDVGRLLIASEKINEFNQ